MYIQYTIASGTFGKVLANLLGCSWSTSKPMPSLCQTTQCWLNREAPGEVVCLYVATFILTFRMFWFLGQLSAPSCTDSLPTNTTGRCSRWKPSNDGSSVHESDGNCQGSGHVDAGTNHAADVRNIREFEWTNVCPGSIWKYSRKHFIPASRNYQSKRSTVV